MKHRIYFSLIAALLVVNFNISIPEALASEPNGVTKIIDQMIVDVDYYPAWQIII